MNRYLLTSLVRDGAVPSVVTHGDDADTMVKNAESQLAANASAKFGVYVLVAELRAAVAIETVTREKDIVAVERDALAAASATLAAKESELEQARADAAKEQENAAKAIGERDAIAAKLAALEAAQAAAAAVSEASAAVDSGDPASSGPVAESGQAG